LVWGVYFVREPIMDSAEGLENLGTGGLAEWRIVVLEVRAIEEREDWSTVLEFLNNLWGLGTV
jgi:hypothetical protein